MSAGSGTRAGTGVSIWGVGFRRLVLVQRRRAEQKARCGHVLRASFGTDWMRVDRLRCLHGGGAVPPPPSRRGRGNFRFILILSNL